MTRNNHPATRAESDVEQRRKKVHGYCWTLNNYTDDDEILIKALDCQYIVYGKEIAPTTGTPHLQGYIYLHSAKTRAAFISWFGISRMHVEACNGSPDENAKYCKKTRAVDDVPNADVYEEGRRPMTQTEKGDANAQRFDNARLAAKEGRFGKSLFNVVLCI